MPHNLPRSILTTRGHRLSGVRHRHRRTEGVELRAGSRTELPRAAMSAEPKPSVRVVARPQGAPTAADFALAKDLLSEEIDFMEHPDFRKSNAERRIFVDAPAVPKPTVNWYRPMMDSLGEQQPRRYEGVLLTAAQERVIFMQFNYARYRMRRVQRTLRGRDPGAAEVRELLTWHRRASAIRDQIAETNLALVLAMAKRVRLGEGEYPDLIGEGNMALMRSVDKFDCARGFKFSTYACRAILKAFSRHGIKVAKHRQRFPVEFDPALEDGDGAATARVDAERQDAAEVRDIVETNRAQLSDVERAVVMHRFALEGADARRQPTLAQVGRLVGLTKERVRQIQNSALAKIRAALEGSTTPRDPEFSVAN
jgi:RNA polymerase primary sigma factor